jgi:hypothetical protein
VSGVTSGRRLAILALALALIGAPAVVLRALCAGESCDEAGAAAARVPFCPLPADVRDLIVAGFRDGRSPDVLATSAEGSAVVRAQAGARVAWPSSSLPDLRVPIVFAGTGIGAGMVPDDTGLDAIAPTLEPVAGIHRPHPDVRSGSAIPQLQTTAGSHLIVLIAWKSIGTAELEADGGGWPALRRLRAEGAGTLDGSAGSLPLDPAATLTTIGTGALPTDHGIVGATIRDERGRVVRAWSGAAPPSIVATFAEDLDEATGQAARIALVARRATDRGLVGGDWYLGADRDDRLIGPGDAARAVGRLLDEGYGADATPDLVGVALEGSVASQDAQTAAIVDRLRASGVPATLVIAGTGSRAPAATVAAATVAARVDAALGANVVASPGSDGLFLDRQAMVAANVTTDDVSTALRSLDAPDGSPLFADAFPAFAVSFSRYC